MALITNKIYKFEVTSSVNPFASVGTGTSFSVTFAWSDYVVNGVKVARIRKESDSSSVILYDENGNSLDVMRFPVSFRFAPSVSAFEYASVFENYVTSSRITLTMQVSNIESNMPIPSPSYDYYGHVVEYHFKAKTDYAYRGNVQMFVDGKESEIISQTIDTNQQDNIIEFAMNGDVLLVVDAVLDVPLKIIQKLDSGISSTLEVDEVSYGSYLNFTISVTNTIVNQYRLSNVSIKMNGVDITEESRITSGNEYFVVNIPEVTGDIEIVANKTENPKIVLNSRKCEYASGSLSENKYYPYGTTLTAYDYDISTSPLLFMILTSDTNFGFNMKIINDFVSVKMGAVSLPCRSESYGNRGDVDYPEFLGVSITSDFTITEDVIFNVEAQKTISLQIYMLTERTFPITKIKVLDNIENETFDVYIQDESENEMHLFTSIGKEHTPEDKIFRGLALSTSPTQMFIPVGYEIDVHLSNDTSLQPLYVDDNPASESLDIILYRSKSEENRVDKTQYLEYIGTLSGTLRTSTSIINPSINIEYAQAPNFNYVFIPLLKRYYYVRDITSLLNNLWAIALDIDALMTYKDEIKLQKGEIIRQENIFNDYIEDSEVKVEKGYDYEYIELESDLFSVTRRGQRIGEIDTNNRVILICIQK